MPAVLHPVVKCSVPGCPKNAHSRGMCRCHYGRFWRGKPLDGSASQREAPSSFNIQSMERQLDEARRNHDLVVGFEGKMRWRRRIEELEGSIQYATQQPVAQQHASVAAG